jgi:hypothetical protein
MLTKETIVRYFTAEKLESLLFFGIGIVALGLSLYFWLGLKTPFYKGMAIPLALIALIQISVGGGVYFRSPKDIERVTNQLQQQPMAIKTEELPRMETVMKKFEIYRYTEIGLALAGLILFFVGTGFWKGLGLGLAIQALLMLGADYFAEQRGENYTKAVQQYANTLKPE